MSILFSQIPDTIGLAKDLQSNGEIVRSIDLLNTYYDKHSQELYAGWLFADALFKNREYDKASDIYTELIKLYPENIDLRLDYARKITNRGLFREALFHLNKLNKDLPKDYKFVVEKTIAKIYFWQGEYEKALLNINIALKIYKNDKELLPLKSDILKIQSNWVKIDASYMDDNQPLTRMTPDIEIGFYHNSRISSMVGVNSSFYSKDFKLYKGAGINGKMIYRFLKSKASMEFGLGLIRLPSGKSSPGGMFILKKELFKSMKLNLKYKYTPYLATTASIDEKVMQNIFGVSIVRDDTRSWMGKISFDIHSFPTFDNSYNAFSSWIVSPDLKLSKVGFRLGYGFNYSDSRKNTFNNILSINELLSLKDTAVIVKGAYDPFFSPKNQKIHSIIGIISYNPVKKINIGLKINYGISATLETPYLFLDNRAGELSIQRNYFNDSYNPVEINGYISYELPNEVSVKAYYNYQRTIYFTSYITGLTTKFLF